MKILTYTSPARGHLYPVVATLLELEARGHQVAVRTVSAEVDGLRELGLDASALNPAVEQRTQQDWRGGSPVEKRKLAVQTFISRAAGETDDLQDVIEDAQPDVVLVDAVALGAQMRAEASGLPWAIYAPAFLPLPRNTSQQGRNFQQAWKELDLSPLNAVRARLGLSPLQHLVNGRRIPLILAYTAEPFEYPRSDWPSFVRLVGPGLWEPPAPAPSWLDEVRQPLVLVVTSSNFQDDARLVQAALDALEHEDVAVVATCPSANGASFRVPANARVEGFVSHTPLIARAACVVCHGGMGVTQKALAHGVPVCVVPFGRDQFEVAKHLEAANAGVSLPADTLTPERLRAAVKQAMTKKEGAGRIAQGFAAAGGPRAAADALEELVNKTLDARSA